MTDAKNATDHETRARRIIDRLKMFNRKERDHLMKFALCEKPEAPEISDSLWALIRRNSGTKPPHPKNMFVGMDYHLNWLHAALATADDGVDELANHRANEWHPETSLEKQGKNVTPVQGNQEDVDLLVAWVDPVPKRLEIVLIEAKLDSGWGSKQFKSKKERLTLIRQDAAKRHPDFIDWRFLLMSPGDPPAKNEFGLDKIAKPHRWLLQKESESTANELWHEKLPVWKTLRQVKRVNEEGADWTTVPSIRADDECNVSGKKT